MSFRVLFIYPNFRNESLIPPGIALLSRILKNNGIEVDLFDTSDYGVDLSKDHDRINERKLGVWPSEHRKLKYGGRDPWKDLNSKINSFQPNLIGLSCTESTFLLGVEAVKNIEHRDSREMPIILGGNLAVCAPERVLDFPEIDLVCAGEGERTLLELCQKLEKGRSYRNVPGLCFRESSGAIRRNPPAPLVDLNQNPTDFDIGLFDPIRLVRPMRGKLYRTAPVETVRGCPYSCGFCNSADSIVRKKSLAKVREELLWYKEKFAVEYMFFWADTFLGMSRREVDEFCEIYADIRLPFWVQTRIETITRWSLKKLQAVGLHRMAFGIENGDEVFRRNVICKSFSNEEAVRKLRIVADLGISYNTNSIVGYPYETRAIAMKTVHLNRRFHGVDSLNCFNFTPYYGTSARAMAVAAGFMDEDQIAGDSLEDSVLNMPGFPKDEICGLSRCFSLYVRFPMSRWPEIRRAETDEELFQKLQAEYREMFFDPKV